MYITLTVHTHKHRNFTKFFTPTSPLSLSLSLHLILLNTRPHWLFRRLRSLLILFGTLHSATDTNYRAWNPRVVSRSQGEWMSSVLRQRVGKGEQQTPLWDMLLVRIFTPLGCAHFLHELWVPCHSKNKGDKNHVSRRGKCKIKTQKSKTSCLLLSTMLLLRAEAEVAAFLNPRLPCGLFCSLKGGGGLCSHAYGG